MNDRTPASVADVIHAKLAERGMVPDGGDLVEITYVAVAKVTVFDTHGGMDVTYRHLDNVHSDNETRLKLAQQAVLDAERHVGGG